MVLNRRLPGILMWISHPIREYRRERDIADPLMAAMNQGNLSLYEAEYVDWGPEEDSAEDEKFFQEGHGEIDSLGIEPFIR